MKQGKFPAVLPLASLNGQNGFKIDGETAGDYAGFIAEAGDVNGDGRPDLIIGAPQCVWATSCSTTGRGYVVFGGSNVGQTGLLSLSSLNGTNGFKLNGEAANDATGGYSVSSAGDINSDGYTDILIGAYGHNSNTGRSYVVFGGPTVGKSGFVSLATLNGSNGFKLDGEAANDYSGFISAVGDMNGDGIADLLIGAHGHASVTGRSYVVFGKPGIGSAGLLSLSSLNGSNGFKLDGEATGDGSGRCVSSGDVNGDGIADLLIGAYGHASFTGRSYVVFGKPGIGNAGLLPLFSLNGINGFKLDGEAINDLSGIFINGMEDINGDSVADLLVGARGHASKVGRSYVIFGGSSLGSSGLIAFSSLNGVKGFKLDGETAGDYSGSWTSVGDINGDGIGDLLISAPGSGSNTGRSYVVFGGVGVGNGGLLALLNLNGVNGFKLDGEAVGGNSDRPISAAGDINGDGIGDLLIGAPNFGSNTGRSYVVFGDSPPVLVNNQLSIATGSKVTLNATYLSATDRNHANESLVFIPSNVRHGRFEILSNPGIPAANFTQQQISNGEIQFVHDGTLIAPSYSMTVRSTGIAYTGPLLGRVTFTGVQPSLFPAVVPLSSLNGKTGFKINFEAAIDTNGAYGAAGGDINGDGFTDLFIGAPCHNSNTGRGYIIFGSPDLGKNGLLSLANLNGINGFKMDGEAANNFAGFSASASDDINGDGYTDMLIGALGYNGGIVGRSYVILGKPGVGSSSPLLLSSMTGSNGFKLDGDSSIGQIEQSARSVSMGDINQDGYADVLIGAPLYNNNVGRSYAFFGGPGVGSSSSISLPSLTGPTGFKLIGEAVNDFSGYPVTVLGDVNGDGCADFLIQSSGHNSNTGRHYVIFGGSGVGASGSLPLSSLNGNNGFKLDGEAPGDYPVSPYPSGVWGSSAGDINGDGVIDILIGAYGRNSFTGRSYVVFGGSGLGAGALALSSLTGSNGFKIDGEAVNDRSGYSVRSAGDINGDGVSDLLIGAPYHAASTGRSYVLFGGSTVGSSGLLSLANLDGTNGFRLDGEAAADKSGSLVASAGDINGDGVSDLLVLDGSNSVSGRGYVVFGDVAPQLNLNQLNINQNQTVILSNQHLNATDFNHPASGLRFNVSNVTQGYFSLVNSTGIPVTSFNQSQLWNGRIQFVHDGGSQTPSYTIQVQSDGLALPPPPQTADIQFYRQPAWQSNQLTVHQGETVLVTAGNLNITEDYPADQVLFQVTELQHGQFQKVPATPVIQFSEQDVLDRQILFVQDSSNSTPGFKVTVSDPYFTLPPSLTNMTFYRRPVVTTNQLTLHQGELVVLSAEHLSIVDDYPSADVVLSASEVRYGGFQLAPLNQSVTQFTQLQLLTGQVRFVPDGSASAPGYHIRAGDPYFSASDVSEATIHFYRRPVVTANQLSIHQGETVVMTPALLTVLDDYPPEQIVLVVNAVQQGRFTATPDNLTLTQFTQQQLAGGQIRFTQDNGADAPGYQVGVMDPYFSVPPTGNATVTFYRRPVFVNNQLTLLEGETVLLTPAMLNVLDDYPDAQVLFTVSDCQQRRFELIPAKNASTIQFTQQQVKTGQIQFTHDNTPQPPNYTVSVDDGYFFVGPMSPQIVFSLVNKPPMLVKPIPFHTVTVGQAFNFDIDPDTFADEQHKPLRLSSAQSTGESLPEGIHFYPPTATFTGLLSTLETYNLSVSATSVADLTTTAFFPLQVAGPSLSPESEFSRWQKTIIGALISGGIGIGFVVAQICLKRAANKKLLQVLGEGDSAYDKDVVRPVAKEIAQRLKITRFMNAITNKELMAFKSAVRSLLSALSEKGVNLNFAEMKHTERDKTINEIGNQTYRWVKGNQKGCAARCPGLHSFFKPQLRPEDLQDAADEIADNIVRVLQKRGQSQQNLSGALSAVKSPVYKKPLDNDHKDGVELDRIDPPSRKGSEPEAAENNPPVSQLN